MKHTEKELLQLREELKEMWQLVLSQVEKARVAFLSSDVELAQEVESREKRINAFDLKIDSDCEQYIALYSPVAVDLRLLLSLIKICNTLERIGDFAEAIARNVVRHQGVKTAQKLRDELEIERMFEVVQSMLSESFVALETENSKIAGKILGKDDEVDDLYHLAFPRLAQAIMAEPTIAEDALHLMLLLRKLERIGDHCSNIVEEVVFYVDAKVLRHRDLAPQNVQD